MNKTIAWVLLTFCFLTVCETGYTARRADYAPGELLIKFKPSKRIIAARFYKRRFGSYTIRSFEKIGIEHVKLQKNLTVKEALEIYRNDPDVEYVEPNYYRYPLATPSDTLFNLLWALENNGQNINGISGTDDADIDAPEAWDISTGSGSIVIALVDSGIDYNHPELAGNVWENSDEIGGNGIDDDGNGYVDDFRGWDFVDNDNDPIDPVGHGTHLAGIVAAVGNNSSGITGVLWTAKIMPLKFFDAKFWGTVSDVVSAIQYANANGAHVINLSFGSTNYSHAEKQAIDASSAVVVCAAGNNAGNNDMTPQYPASYSSANIIAVAASDQHDNLASFSNFGPSSVDVAAPGINIYSTTPTRQSVWRETFDDNDISDWITGGTNNDWATTDTFSFNGGYSLSESPAGIYQSDTDSWAIAPVLDLSSYHGVKLVFRIMGISEIDIDFLQVQISTDLTNWADQYVEIDDTVYSRISGPYSGSWRTVTVDLGAYDGSNTVYLRFLFSTDNSGEYDGFYIDDVTVTAASTAYSGTDYRYYNGTSMATSFVAGVAALIKSRYPSANSAEIIAHIKNTVDVKPLLEGKVASNGRVNAAKSLQSAPPPVAEGISAGGGGGGGCFVATAAFGSKMNPQVKILRTFRDHFLLNNPPGRVFVGLYYKHSPPVAAFIRKHESMKAFARIILLPLAGVSWLALKLGPTLTSAILLVFFGATAILLIFRKHIVYFIAFKQRPLYRNS